MLPLLATDAGVRLQLETGIASHRAPLRRLGRRLLAARVRPRAVARRAARGGRRARHLRRLDRRSARTAAAPQRGRRRARPARPRGDRPRLARARLPGARRLPRLAPADARARHAVWANDGSPYDPERGAARARAARAASSSRRSTTARSSPSTPSSSATTGTRASRSCETVLELADVVPLDVDARARRRPTSPPTSWGAGRDLRTWSAPGRARVDAAQRRAAGARRATPSPRALRELLALQSSDWAFLIVNAHRGRLSARARRRATTQRSSTHCSGEAIRRVAQSGSTAGGLGLRPALRLKVVADAAEHLKQAACKCRPS